MVTAKERPTIEPQLRRGAIGAKGEPVPISQDDIEAMAAGGAKAKETAERLFRAGAPGEPEPVQLDETRAAKEAPTKAPPQR